MDNIIRGEHGLSCSMNLHSFDMADHISPSFKVSPLGLHRGLQLTAGFEAMRNRNYIIPQLMRLKDHGVVVICSEYDFHPDWYSFVTDCMVFYKDRVNLKEVLKWQTNTVFIGEKRIQFTDSIFSENGTELARVSVLIGIVDLSLRQSISIPNAIQAKAKFIEDPVKPIFVDVNEPMTNHMISQENVVQMENIDINRHTNYGYYVEVAVEAFKMIGQNPYLLEKFVILLKKETFLNDTLKTVAWNNNVTGQYCCETSCNDKLVMFCKATFRDQPSKL